MNETLPPIGQANCREISELLGRVGDRWSALIIMELYDEPRRFNAIKRALDGISQQMLTRALKNLERDGMITRTVYATVPPQVEYALTDLGRSFSQPVRALGQWARSNLPEIQHRRAAYDFRRGK